MPILVSERMKFSEMRSEVQRQVWLNPTYRQHMIAVHTGKRYPSASLKKMGRPAWNRTNLWKMCARCSKRFKIPPARLSKAKFCSRKCQNGPRYPCKCEICGEVTHLPPNRLPRARFCSAACKAIFVLRSMPKSKTKIEGLMMHALKRIGIRFLPQYAVGRAIPDITIPNQRIAVFCDGNYFHNLPEGRARDARVNMRLRNLGWHVLRFSETDILKNPYACADAVRKACEL